MNATLIPNHCSILLNKQLKGKFSYRNVVKYLQSKNMPKYSKLLKYAQVFSTTSYICFLLALDYVHSQWLALRGKKCKNIWCPRDL